MGKINVAKIVMGGLLAGLVVNISETILNMVVVSSDMEAFLQARNLPPMNNQTIGGFVGLAFVLGIVIIWLYAAIRPRFGPGLGTAATAGLAVWFFAYLYPGVANGLLGMYPMKLNVITLVWGLAEIVLGSIAGAWVYAE